MTGKGEHVPARRLFPVPVGSGPGMTDGRPVRHSIGLVVLRAGRRVPLNVTAHLDLVVLTIPVADPLMRREGGGIPFR